MTNNLGNLQRPSLTQVLKSAWAPAVKAPSSAESRWLRKSEAKPILLTSTQPLGSGVTDPGTPRVPISGTSLSRIAVAKFFSLEWLEFPLCLALLLMKEMHQTTRGKANFVFYGQNLLYFKILFQIHEFLHLPTVAECGQASWLKLWQYTGEIPPGPKNHCSLHSGNEAFLCRPQSSFMKEPNFL